MNALPQFGNSVGSFLQRRDPRIIPVYTTRYTMDNVSGTTLYDESATYDATLNGTYTFDVGLYNSHELNLGGTSADYALTQYGLLNVGTGNITIVAYVKLPNLQDQTIISSRFGTPASGVELLTLYTSGTAGTVNFAIYDGTSGYAVNSASVADLYDGNYHTIIAYRDAANELAVEIDGVKTSNPISTSGLNLDSAAVGRIGISPLNPTIRPMTDPIWEIIVYHGLYSTGDKAGLQL